MSTHEDETSTSSNTNLFQMLKFEELKIDLDDRVLNHLHSEYRGEGNENLVLSLPEIRFVLRLRKSHTNDVINSSWEKEKLKISLLYYNIVLLPFLSDRYLTLPIIAEISETYVKYLDEKLFHERPGHRRDKKIGFNGIEIHPDYTFLSQYSHYQRLETPPSLGQALESDSLKKLFSHDYLDFRNYVYSLLTIPAFVSDCNRTREHLNRTTFSVEIKPKQAWTAEPYRRFDVCAFCMHQYFKLHEHKIESKSRYCPLDLFSGIEERMENALKGLLLTPQNNLKIFKNGEMVFGESKADNIEQILAEWFSKSRSDGDMNWCRNHFSKLLTTILKTDFIPDQKLASFETELYVGSNKHQICSNEEIEQIKKAFHDSNLKCDHNSTDLPQNCILNRVKELQKLDKVGLEAVYDFYETHTKKTCSEFSHINDVISKTKPQSSDATMPILNVVEAYTLSTAAKDLSIMIAVQNLAENSGSSSGFVVDIDGFKYDVNISLVDVGPKPISCVSKHWKRDKKMLASCLNYFYPNLNVE
ncbi:inositol-pentakisphosphate 2-kinase-like [Planococcus citri]|uniref:inositol-pentakisphosphate 2-kinase-like n=1 Tax=Planococcus citri TaxID=170843 RepID=UPI0031F9722B